MSFARDVLDEADRLGLTWWEHLCLVLAVALLSAAGRRAGSALWERIRKIEWGGPPPVDPSGPGDSPEYPLPHPQPGPPYEP